MNQKQKKRIQQIIHELENLQTEISSMGGEERDKCCSVPDHLAVKFEESADRLDEIYDNIRDALDALNELTDSKE